MPHRQKEKNNFSRKCRNYVRAQNIFKRVQTQNLKVLGVEGASHTACGSLACPLIFIRSRFRPARRRVRRVRVLLAAGLPRFARNGWSETKAYCSAICRISIASSGIFLLFFLQKTIKNPRAQKYV